ncbi:MAG: DUF2508 family protein [Lachnospiraceae bacterium]|nr:DUF2508 family protein [Lachnospiraceae bacterium]
MLLMRFKKPQKQNGNPQLKEDFLKKALIDAQKRYENAYKGFQSVDDPDLIDSYIYEINAANLRYNVLLRDVKAITALQGKR